MCPQEQRTHHSADRLGPVIKLQKDDGMISKDKIGNGQGLKSWLRLMPVAPVRPAVYFEPIAHHPSSKQSGAFSNMKAVRTCPTRVWFDYSSAESQTKSLCFAGISKLINYVVRSLVLHGITHVTNFEPLTEIHDNEAARALPECCRERDMIWPLSVVVFMLIIIKP